MKLRLKLTLALLATGSGLLLGLPLLIGLGVQRTAPLAIEELDRQLAAFSVRLVAVERHWFSTELSLAIDAVDGAAGLTYQTELEHGPWPLRQPAWLHGRGRLIHSELALVAEDEWQLSPGFDFSARIRSHWQQAHCGQAMDLELELEANRQLSRIRLTVLPSELTFPGQFQSRALRGYGQFNRDSDNNWQLELQLNADVLGDDQWPQLLTDPALRLTLEANRRELGLATEITIGRFSQGADHDYHKITTRLALNGLHRETLANWLETVVAAHKGGLRGQYLVEKASGDLLLALPVLLRFLPEAEIQSLQFDSPRGAAELSFRLGLSSAPPAGFLLNPAVLLEVADARASIRVAQPLAQHWALLQARAELGAGASQAAISTASDDFLLRLRANQLLISKGDSYHLKMALARSELTLNGQSMYLPTF